MPFLDNLRDVARAAMNMHAVPGVAIGVTTAAERQTLALGVTTLDTSFAVRPDTIFQIGSISKPFTATLVMQLVEQGKLDLDIPVSTFVPDLSLRSQTAASQITLRHLLTHQGGFWGDWFDDFGLADDAIERFVAEYHRLPQLFEPGTLWAYNNCGYILAGHIAAQAQGSTYESALLDQLLNPLGLSHTFLSAAEAIAYPVAVGHLAAAGNNPPEIARQFLRPRARNPAGGVLASVEDVLTFADLHLGRVEGVLDAQSVRMMRQPQIDTFEAGTAWGIGFAIREATGGVVVGHGGATNGFRASLEMVPSAGFGIVVLTNSDRGNRCASDIVDWVLEDRLGITPGTLPECALDSEDKTTYEGRYVQPYASIELRQDEHGLCGQLTTHSPYSENAETQSGPWFDLGYVGNDRFVIKGGDLENSQIKIWRHEDGSIRFLQAGGRLYRPGSWEPVEE